MGKKEVVKVLVEGGNATPGPPLGPKLGPLGVPVAKIVQEINEKTKDFKGLQVPVEIIIDVESKTWEIKIGTPPVSQLIKKELGIEKGAHSSKHEVVGNLSMEQVIKIALLKKDSLRAKTLKGAVKTVLGTCVSMGVNVEGKDPRVVTKEVDEGVYDDLIKKYEEEWKK